MILPVSIKIVLAIAVVMVILLVIALIKKDRKRIWTLIILGLLDAGAGLWLGLREYNRTNKDPLHAKAQFSVLANDLIKEFESGDSTVVNRKYNDAIVEVNGNVKELKKEGLDYTIILGDSSSMSSVQCEMNVNYHPDAAPPGRGSSLKLKGHFVGFQRGEEMMGVSLGSTINLNRCVIVDNKN